ncbi:MAG: hypothetical protein ACRC6I_20450 [Paracoccaceae bacterium]
MFLDPNHPMFRAAWARWLCVIIPTAWAVFEFSIASPFWGILFAALGVVGFYKLIWIGPDHAPGPGNRPNSG